MTQALITVKFSMNEASKFSPDYMLFGRDVVLPVNLKQRRKYIGADHHTIILEE